MTTEINPAEVMAEHKGHHEMLGSKCCDCGMARDSCQPYRLAAEVATLRAQVQRVRDWRDGQMPPDQVLRMKGRWIEINLSDLDAALDTPEVPSEAKGQGEDEHRHVWRFDGDDPYLVCACGAVKEALTGLVIR